jgi:hypothetical protein
MATTVNIPKGGELPPRGWKNRFMRRGQSKEPKNRRQEDDIPTEEDNGMKRSLSAKRSQRTKKGGVLIRKLKTLNNSFRKGGIDVNTEQPYPSVLNDSHSSPSNPQSPFSTDSFVTVEVRWKTCNLKSSKKSLWVSYTSSFVFKSDSEIKDDNI